MTKDYMYVKDIQSHIDFVNKGLFKSNMKLSLITEIVDNKKTWCILCMNDNKIYADFAKDFKQEIIFALDNAHHLGYCQAIKASA